MTSATKRKSKMDKAMEILAGINSIENLPREKYTELKEARISDDVIATYFGVNGNYMTNYKRENGLLGITVPGYEKVSTFAQDASESSITFVDSEEESHKEKITTESNSEFSRRKLPPIDAQNIELHLAIADAADNTRMLEKKIFELKQAHKQELNEELNILRSAHQLEINSLKASLPKAASVEFHPDVAIDKIHLEEQINTLKHQMEYIMSVNSNLEETIHMMNLSSKADNDAAQTRINTAKKAIKNLVKLI